ncbi:hypothetical protein ACLOJK_032759 [Asimina triloba]
MPLGSEIELSIELVVVKALNESRHVYFFGQTGHLVSFSIEAGNVVLQGHTRCLPNAHKLCRDDVMLVLVTKSSFKEVDKLFEAGDRVEGEEGKPHLAMLIQCDGESKTFEAFRRYSQIHVDDVVYDMTTGEGVSTGMFGQLRCLKGHREARDIYCNGADIDVAEAGSTCVRASQLLLKILFELSLYLKGEDHQGLTKRLKRDEENVERERESQKD